MAACVYFVAPWCFLSCPAQGQQMSHVILHNIMVPAIPSTALCCPLRRSDTDERWHCAVILEPALLPRQPVHLLRVHPPDDLPQRPLRLPLLAHRRQVGVRLDGRPLPCHDLHVPQPGHGRPGLPGRHRQVRLHREHHVQRAGAPAGAQPFFHMAPSVALLPLRLHAACFLRMENSHAKHS